MGLPRAPRHFIFSCPALYIHSNHSFYQCSALFYHLHFSSDPGAAPGWDESRTIWLAHKPRKDILNKVEVSILKLCFNIYVTTRSSAKSGTYQKWLHEDFTFFGRRPIVWQPAFFDTNIMRSYDSGVCIRAETSKHFWNCNTNVAFCDNYMVLKRIV